MRKTLSVRPVEDRDETPKLQKKGRGWNIAESRLDTLHEAAREMRRNPTEAQAALAESLGRAELGKFRFRRHVVIGSAIVDFACQTLRVVVQIDEPSEDPALDRRRDRSLEEVGMKVLRFPAADILADADAVTKTIVAEMKANYDAQRAKANSRPSRPRTQNAPYPSKGRGYQR